ncbi:MAG: cytochrome P450 [Actinobacteria bacterium]|nr:cytochrome P450 [Actinomycetota bacterium]
MAIEVPQGATEPAAGVSSLADDPWSIPNLTDPYPLFERMRDAGPAVWLEQYGVHSFTRFDSVREILVDHETYISGAGVGPTNLHATPNWRPQGILESDPPRHTPMRTAMTSVIAPRKMRALRPGFDAYAEELVAQVLATDTPELVHDLAEEFGRRENLLSHGAMNFSFFGPDNDLHRQHVAAGEGTPEWVLANCDRSALSADGMGAQIWEQADAGVIPPEQATLLIRAMLSAGLDTTVFAITNTLVCLARHPEQWAMVHDDPTLIKFAIDETLRYESPFTAFFRTTSRDMVLDGVALPAGSKLLVFLGAANRDPRKWGDTADAFDINRDAGGQLAFGMGIHQCVGQPISRQESQAVLEEFARRVERIELPAEPTIYLHNTLRSWSSLPARLVSA